jgi:UDP-N-acetylglucosamine 2-epimerase (non-hydrolysing)
LIVPFDELIVLSEGPAQSSAVSLFAWFFKTLFKTLLGRTSMPKNRAGQKGRLVVHGDTISTVLGTILGRALGYPVSHVEAGLRSFNLLRPFPEEICRVIVSYLSQEAFCPNDWAARNLQSRRMEIVNSGGNTLVDSLELALTERPTSALFNSLPIRYFIFVLHRQENVYDRDFVRRMVRTLIEKSSEIPAVVILHKPTRTAFEKEGLLAELETNEQIRLVSRLPYIDFTHLLHRSEFIMTDGGSNQEESYYLGKPCLILRSETERIEGLGENALLSLRNFDNINEFLKNPDLYRRPAVRSAGQPSELIANRLKSLTGEA